MKKCICFFLCLVLFCSLFAGCGQETPAETEPSAADAAASAQQSETEPAEPLSFSLGSLPEIGAFAPNEKKDYFFPDGPHDVFEPRDDYGEIMPYCTDVRYYKEVPSYTYEDENGEEYTEVMETRFHTYLYKFGLMTTDGRIITSGIYDSFWEETDENGNKAFRLLIDDPEGLFMSDTHVVGADGSWMLTYDKYVNIMSETSIKNGWFHAQTFQDDFWEIPEQSLGINEYFLYDGTKLDWMEHYLQNSDVNTEIVYLDEDLVLLTQSKEEADETVCICCGLDGTERHRFRVKGSVSVLCDGVLENRTYGGNGGFSSLLDFEGNRLLEKKEEFVYDKQAQIILAKGRKADRVQAYNTACKELWTASFPWDWVQVLVGENSVMIFDDKNQTLYRLSDGQPVDFGIEDPDRVIPLDQYIQGHATRYFLVTTKGEDIYVFDHNAAQLAKIKKPRIEHYEDDESEWDIPWVHIQNGFLFSAAEDQWYLYDLSTGKETVLPTHGIIFGRQEDENEYWKIENLDRNHLILYHSVEDLYGARLLFEAQTGRLLDQDLVFFEQVGNRILLVTSSYSCVYQTDGSMLLRLQNNHLA